MAAGEGRGEVGRRLGRVGGVWPNSCNAMTTKLAAKQAVNVRRVEILERLSGRFVW